MRRTDGYTNSYTYISFTGIRGLKEQLSEVLLVYALSNRPSLCADPTEIANYPFFTTALAVTLLPISETHSQDLSIFSADNEHCNQYRKAVHS